LRRSRHRRHEPETVAFPRRAERSDVDDRLRPARCIAGRMASGLSVRSWERAAPEPTPRRGAALVRIRVRREVIREQFTR
jgi:hypothetical protein